MLPVAVRRPLECLHELAPQPAPSLPLGREPPRKVPSLAVSPLVDDQLPRRAASHAAQRLGPELQPAAVGVFRRFLAECIVFQRHIRPLVAGKAPQDLVSLRVIRPAIGFPRRSVELRDRLAECDFARHGAPIISRDGRRGEAGRSWRSGGTTGHDRKRRDRRGCAIQGPLVRMTASTTSGPTRTPPRARCSRPVVGVVGPGHASRRSNDGATPASTETPPVGCANKCRRYSGRGLAGPGQADVGLGLRGECRRCGDRRVPAGAPRNAAASVRPSRAAPRA